MRLVARLGDRHAWNYPYRHFDLDSSWCLADLALQLRLGLLSIRWHRLGVGDPADPRRHGKGIAERVRIQHPDATSQSW